MSRAVKTGSTDQSIRVWAYDSDGAAITGESYNSAGIAVSVVVRSAGRIVSTTALTLVDRSGAGEHTDSAFTEVGAGEYVVDLADTYSATAERHVSVTLTSTAISGGYVLSETLAVGIAVELDSASLIRFVTEDTGETAAADGSVAKLAQGAGGSGTATLEKQEEILEEIRTYASSMLATVDGSAATIVGFPETLVIGDSYTTDGSNAIHVFVRDSNDGPVTAVGTHEFTDSDFAPEVIITTSGRAGRVRASVTWVPGGSEGYLKIQIPLSESHRAAPGAATVQVVLKWTGCEKTIATQTVTWIPRI